MSYCPVDPAYELEGAPSDTVIVLAHGAGANRESDFMLAMARGLVAQGYQVLRFNFPYMQANALDGKKRPPDRAPVLLACLAKMLAIASAQPRVKRVVLMGKSMGGRMAAQL
ncbi:MAG: alpha/beta family hydrolase, partial [Shewanella sp.]